MAHLTGETWNMLAMEFNDGLESLLASLSLKLNGLRYSIADFYGFSNATFMNSSAAEQAAKLAAAAFYDGPAQFTVPINFKKLVQGK
ncbi:hypothetical protein PR202_ga07245 [Eleusine coracana subsp. coracana]|uniref:Uncharacterized protein n=1 Tax=Eleusine coracana subsp. coracana TaxID=191504 RepID=A0AAV5BYS9_ELECO|nr:hypothetical protein PR202_ga07245 [Eleusine coracana subsp. coracana]